MSTYRFWIIVGILIFLFPLFVFCLVILAMILRGRFQHIIVESFNYPFNSVHFMYLGSLLLDVCMFAIIISLDELSVFLVSL